MSPEQIDAVVTSWSALQAFPIERLRRSIAVHLPPNECWPADEHAAWIMRTVDRLHGLLDRPGLLAIEAAEVIAERKPCGPGSLALEQEALLAGLHESLGDMDDDVARAWRHACHLFAEVIAARTLAPFGPRPGRKVVP
jgi:hypothetical protein